MPLIIPSNSISAGGYDVDNSLRFNDDSSDYLNRTGGTATDGKKFTYSAWFKRSEIGGGNELFCIYADNTNRLFLRNNGDTFEFQMFGTFGSTTRQFRDPSAWYHFVIACDSTQATASDRGKWYLNGELIMTGSISLNQVFPHGQSTPNFIIGNGEYNNTVYTQYWDGYQSEVCFIDGQQLDPTSFGEFDEDSGIWKPIDVSGLTFGNNGFYLDFENSGSLGADVSGNGNNFTVNNLTAIDQSTDTPTNNFCTLTPLATDYNGTLSEGNLKQTGSGSTNSKTHGTIGFTSGKWYAEFKILDVGTEARVGIVELGGTFSGDDGSFPAGTDAYLLACYEAGIVKYINGSATVVSSGGTGAISQNDIVSIAVDFDNHNFYVAVAGQWSNGSGSFNQTFANSTPVAITETGEYFTFLAGDEGNADTGITDSNFGNPIHSISSGNTDGNGYGNFEYAVPSGYLSLCTKNLSEVLG